MTTKIHTCKHCRCPYTVCPQCQGQYCAVYWKGVCPRARWHPGHGDTPEEIGRRYQALEQGRQEGVRRLAALERGRG